MKKICMYMDEAQDIGAVKNDAELAKKLGISRASVSEWRSGKSTPNDDQAVKLAEVLGKEPGELLAECGAARAKTPATRQAWERIAARMAMSITLCALIIHPSQSEAAEGRNVCNLLFSEVMNNPELPPSKACQQARWCHFSPLSPLRSSSVEIASTASPRSSSFMCT